MLPSLDCGILLPSGLAGFIAVIAALLLMRRDVVIKRALTSSLHVTATSTPRLRTIAAAGAALLVACSVMRPYWGAEDIKIETTGDDVIFLVDISRSMYASDLPPSRLEVAKRKMKDLVSLMTSNGQAARFGITVFAGDGYTVCPLTIDRGVLTQFIDVISPDLVTSLGSNLKAGIDTALLKLDDTAARHSRVILLSDGEDSYLDAEGLVKQVNTRGVRFDVLGLGTAQGAPIELPNGARVVDQNHQLVISSLHEKSLRAIADAGRGLYVQATIDDADISQLVQTQLTSSAGNRSLQDSSFRTYREFGSWLDLGALVLLLVAAFVRGANPLVIILLSVAALPAAELHAQTGTPSASVNESTSPFKLYEQGDFNGALTQYQKRLAKDPTNQDLQQGLASTLYRLGRYSESAEIFQSLANQTSSGRLYYENMYNYGNTQLKLERYQDAIDAFRKALDVKPDDEQAAHNLEVARALLEEQKQRARVPTPTPTATPSATPTSQPPPQSESTPPPPSPSSKPEDSPSPGQESQTPTPATTGAQGTTTETPAASPQPDAKNTNDAPEPGTTQEPEATTKPEASGEQPPATSPPLHQPKESLDKDPQQEDSKQAAAQETKPSGDLAAPDVDAWLQSLPDSPLLIRRHRGAQQQNGKTW